MDPLSRIALAFVMFVIYVFLLGHNKYSQNGPVVIFETLSVTTLTLGLSELTMIFLGPLFLALPIVNSFTVLTILTIISVIVTFLLEGRLDRSDEKNDGPQILLKSDPFELSEHPVHGLHAVVGVAMVDGQLGVFRDIFDPTDGPDLVDADFWGLYTWDPVTCWRAMQLLLCMRSSSDFGDLHRAFAAAKRKPDADDAKGAQRVRQNVGAEKYQEIMDAPIPGKVIEFYYKFSKEEGLDRTTFTEEVRAGTIAWNENYEKIGIKHPDKSRRKLD